MIVRVIGAGERALRQVRASAPAGVDVTDEAIAEPDWILVATEQQRIDALRATGLPPFRVLHVPEIADDLDRSVQDALRTVFAKIEGIGAWRPLTSGVGVRLAAIAVRGIVHDIVPGGTAQPSTEPAPVALGTGGLRTRMPVGERLDQLLNERALDRARRFASNTVRLG